MMKVSTKSTYAIRALIHLGRHAEGHPVRASVIAEREKIPLPFLEQIFSKLKKAGLIEAIRGPQGGYKLSRNPAEITLKDIIVTLEGPLAPVLCTMPEKHSENCHEVDGCASRTICNELDGQLSRILSQNTLESLCGEADRLNDIPVRMEIQRSND